MVNIKKKSLRVVSLFLQGKGVSLLRRRDTPFPCKINVQPTRDTVSYAQPVSLAKEETPRAYKNHQRKASKGQKKYAKEKIKASHKRYDTTLFVALIFSVLF